MFYIPGALFAASDYDLVKVNLSWGRYFYKNLIPVLLGNLVGGVILMGFGYWYIYLTPDNCCSNKNNDIIPIDKNVPVPEMNNQPEIINQNNVTDVKNDN